MLWNRKGMFRIWGRKKKVTSVLYMQKPKNVTDFELWIPCALPCYPLLDSTYWKTSMFTFSGTYFCWFSCSHTLLVWVLLSFTVRYSSLHLCLGSWNLSPYQVNVADQDSKQQSRWERIILHNQPFRVLFAFIYFNKAFNT